MHPCEYPRKTLWIREGSGWDWPGWGFSKLPGIPGGLEWDDPFPGKPSWVNPAGKVGRADNEERSVHLAPIWDVSVHASICFRTAGSAGSLQPCRVVNPGSASP